MGHFWAGQLLLFFLLRRPNKTVRACMQDNPLPTTKCSRNLKESAPCPCPHNLTILVWEFPRFQTWSLHQARDSGTWVSGRDNPRAQSFARKARRHRLNIPAYLPSEPLGPPATASFPRQLCQRGARTLKRTSG